MASSNGVNALTGGTLTDWDHVQQSIRNILLTPIGSRVMRRDFGSNLPDLVDAKILPANILAVYSAAATAISKWEPRFRMSSGSLLRADGSGVLSLAILGTYYPRGHLGDYSVAQSASTRIAFERAI